LIEKHLYIDSQLGCIQNLTEILPIHHKTLIDLIYFQGFTQLETAEYLAIPLGTVKTHLRAAMSQLKQAF
jgi:DNA-directed RNA polymerase specialized sigma24 family protein